MTRKIDEIFARGVWNERLAKGLVERCDAVEQMLEAGEEYMPIVQFLREALRDYLSHVDERVPDEKKSLRLWRAMAEAFEVDDYARVRLDKWERAKYGGGLE